MSVLDDVKYSYRGLKSQWRHSLLCVVVIGLCIGLSWTVLSVYYRMFIMPVNFHEGEQWYGFIETTGNAVNARTSNIDYFTYQALQEEFQNTDFSGGFQLQSANLTTDTIATRVTSAALTPGVFSASGIQPLIGRGLLASDTNAFPAAVLSNDIWANEFASDESIVGENIFINGVAHTVVGVLKKDSFLIAPFDTYTSMLPISVALPDPKQRITPVFKLSNPSLIANLQRHLQQAFINIETTYPDIYRESRVIELAPLNQALNGANPALSIAMKIWGIAGIVILLLGCINVANLLVARAAEQSREYSLRNALGGSRIRLVRLSLINSFNICFLGGLLGTAISYAAGYYLLYLTQSISVGVANILPMDNNPQPIFEEFILLAVSLSMVWILSSVLPVLSIVKQSPSEILATGGKGSTSGGDFRLSRITISLQIICSCFLLVISGTLVYAMKQFNTTDYGFSSENLWTASIELPNEQFTQAQRQILAQQLVDEFSNHNGVNNAGIGSALPGVMTDTVRFRLRDRDLITNGEFPWVSFVSIDDRFLTTLGTGIVQGRNFERTDTIESSHVVIVDQRLATRLWPNKSAVGKEIQLQANQDGPWATVVGVSEPVIANWPGAFSRPIIYQPLSQSSFQRFSVVAKITNDTVNASDVIRTVTRQANSNVAPYHIFTMDQHFNNIGAGGLFLSGMFVSVAFCTVILAVIGIYGVVSRSLVLRTTEIGVRRALGSSIAKISWTYLRRSLSYVAIGCLLGGGGALLFAEAMSNFLNSPSTAIPIIYISVCIGLFLFTSLATLLPVRKAVGLEPGEALHYQ